MSSGWTFHRWKALNTAHGTVFYPPEGKSLAAVHVREHLRPVQPIARLAQQVQQSLSAVTIHQTSSVEAIQTKEAEYAACVEMLGVDQEGRPFHAMLACIWGDDFYDRVDAYFVGDSAKVHEYRALTREFILNYRLNLGENRARFYYYVPPSGWQGRRRGLLAQWFTLDFPKRPSQIFVAAACPTDKIEASVMARVALTRRMYDFAVQHAASETFAQAYNLAFELRHVRGRFKQRHLHATDVYTAILTDKHYSYIARLETMAPWVAEDRALFGQLVQSIRPIPRAGVDMNKLLSWMVVD